ncbi:MAG: bifunctional salicylyl-CoA 5-hydroxylase/oxidoreductase [Pseudomonadota bacterium]|nr:bifunctional salicylyl-CoA 5-hydroxylase/oxidoreductase [Pseudomonadota bacterium]
MKIAIIGGGPGGLYLALLAKKTWPSHDIHVYERNRAEDTFGFGVVFSDETLDAFLARDPESYDAITDQFAYWDEIDFNLHGETVRSTGHGFCGCGRVELLQILQRRCAEVGVVIDYSTEINNPADIDADLVVGADGINSVVRDAFADYFQPSFKWRKNRFAWLGTTKPYDAFTFDFTEDDHGIWVLGAYQYKEGMSTWIVEAPERTWANAEKAVGGLSDETLVSYMTQLWAHRLENGKHDLIPNKTVWRQFPMIRCANWSHDRYMLIGDALHTAHYSIGSGTKLAMEDAIALVDALAETDSIPDAQRKFEELRREEVEKTQHAAEVSVIWTEEPHRYWDMTPLQAAFSMMSRSKQVTYENLRLRDPALIDRVDTWFANDVRKSGLDVAENAPPMFTPFRLRNMTLANRVVVSPMDMYSSVDGVPGDFHFVHLGSMALGGAGLIFSEMTCVSADGRITPGCAGLYTDDQTAAWKRVIDFVHAQSDAKFCLQIGHAGRKGSTRVGWEGMDMPLERDNWEIIAPSPLPHAPDMHTPREMTRDDMDRVRDNFVAAARRSETAGADMIELHMAHGYLLSSFITPVANRRTDEYGGSLENRIRFPLEVFDAVRAVWPDEKPISARISATDWVGATGVTGEEAVEIARMLKDRGCDIIDVSAGQTTPDAKPIYGRMFQTPFSEQVRNEAPIPTIAVGNITTSDQVNTILAAGRADLVALARPHLTNPHFTLEASAWYGQTHQRWPLSYDPAKDQAFRMAQRDRAEDLELKKAAAPSSHRNSETD